MKRVIILTLSAVMISLIACSNEARTNKVDQYDWSTNMIQVEERSGDGKWYAREPIPLNKQWRFQGSAVGKPDYEVVFEVSGDSKRGLILNRKVMLTCDGGASISHTLNMHDMQYGWNATGICNGREWKMSIADTNAVLRPPDADSNKIVPELRQNAS